MKPLDASKAGPSLASRVQCPHGEMRVRQTRHILRLRNNVFTCILGLQASYPNTATHVGVLLDSLSTYERQM